MTKRHSCPKCKREYTHDECYCGKSSRKTVWCGPCLYAATGKECNFRGEEFVDEFKEYCRKVLMNLKNTVT